MFSFDFQLHWYV